MLTLVTMVTWGIPSHPDNSEVSGAIRSCQRLNSGYILVNAPELLRYGYVSLPIIFNNSLPIFMNLVN
jgi:hypothetical protein